MSQEARCEELLAECDTLRQQASRAEREARTSSTTLAEREQALAAASGAKKVLEQQLQEARAEARARAAAALQAARDLDDARARLGQLEADAEGMRAILRDMQARHVEQINKWVWAVMGG